MLQYYCYGTSDYVDLNGNINAKAYVYFNPNKQMIETLELRDELEKAKRKWMEGKLRTNAPIMRFFLDLVKGEELKIDEREFDDECFIRNFFPVSAIRINLRIRYWTSTEPAMRWMSFSD